MCHVACVRASLRSLTTCDFVCRAAVQRYLWRYGDAYDDSEDEAPEFGYRPPERKQTGQQPASSQAGAKGGKGRK